MNYDTLIENFPGVPRPQQDQALHALSAWVEQNKPGAISFFGCDAPTGVGKSFLALSLAKAYQKQYGGQVWIVTQNKLLQAQYMKDFPDDLYLLMGLDNYQCFSDHG